MRLESPVRLSSSMNAESTFFVSFRHTREW